MSPPTGNLTFLFTDIERSSQLWEQHPQAMGRALARHDALLRETFEEHEGFAFKAMGDAFCVAFAQAGEAVRTAIAVQRRLAGEPWEETGALRVRIALHSGEAEERDGDYFGQTLNRTARLLASAHGGQTLLSRVAAERVRETLPDEASLRDLGERRLKDLSRPERIFQLVVRDLPHEFPPLRSLEVLPNNLPAQVTTFIGRERELAEVKRQLAGARLLTLTGPGGMGKTRLALQLGAEMLESFAHGVWLVELAMVSEPELVAHAVAAALEIREEPGRPILATLVDAVRQRRLLLLLDNCEHVIHPCAEIGSALLRQAPDVRIVATSREPLNIAGEIAWAVPALKLDGIVSSAHVETLTVDAIAALEAVQLFVERAAAVRPGFALTEANARTLAKICWRLDGLPLAIELASARVKVLSPAQILERLDDRFRLLSGGSRTAQRRQQTLGALIDWSYDLLSEHERALLRRLSVFVRGRTLEMAEQVCAGDGIEPGEVLDLLGSLVDKSLVAVEEEPGAEPRYVLLESVWDYAHEKLAQAGEEERYAERHLDYFTRLAERAAPELMGPAQAAWLERLELEQGNFRTALEWSERRPAAIERGLRLAGALERFWEVRGYLAEGREIYKRLLALADESVAPAARLSALDGAGRLAWCQDDDDAALDYYGAALRLAEELGDRERAGLLHALLGFTERNESRREAAYAHFRQALATGAELRSERLQAVASSGLSSLAGDDGDLAQSRAMKERSLAYFRRVGDRWLQGLLCWALGKVTIAQADYAAARAYFTEAVDVGRELGNQWATTYSLEGFGGIALGLGDPAHATRLYAAASVARAAAGLSFSPLERTGYDETIARLCAALPPERFVVEWEAGRAVPPEQTLASFLETPL